MRKTAAILTFVFIACSSIAQYPWFKHVEYHQGKKDFFEITGGASLVQLAYSDPKISDIRQIPRFQPLIQASYRHQFKKYISFAPTLAFETKGVKLDYNKQYQLDAYYIGFHLPVEYNVKRNPHIKKKSKYFVFASPFLSTPVAGTIKTTDMKLPLSQANINILDYGIELGNGIRIPTLSSSGTTYIRIRASYIHSFANSYSPMEVKGESISVNDEAYSNIGTRKFRGLKISIGLEIPFKNDKNYMYIAGGDGKKTYTMYLNPHE